MGFWRSNAKGRLAPPGRVRRSVWSFAPSAALLGTWVYYVGSGGSHAATLLLYAALGASVVSSVWMLLFGRWQRWRLRAQERLEAGDLEGAERWFQACRRAALLMPRHCRLAPLRGLLETARRRHDLKRAEQWARRLVVTEEAVFGSGHRNCAAALNNLACLCQSQEKLNDAVDYYQQSIEIWLQSGPEEPDCAITLRNLGQLHGERGNHAAAEPCLRHALAIQEKILAPAAELYLSRKVLAQSCLAQGQAEEAEWLLRRACRAAIDAWGPDHGQVAHVRSDLAQLYAAQGRYGEADEWFRMSLETLRKSRGLQHPEAAGVLEKYAVFLQHAAEIPPDAAQC